MEGLFASIRAHLSAAKGLVSLRFQNHLYGCYLLLEDIVQKNVKLNGTRVIGSNISFDLRTHFSQIGLRYGFAMDTQLLLMPCPADYQEAWIQQFTTIQSLEQVDALEETVNEIIQQTVCAEDAFFMNTVDGMLSPEWIERALTLLLPKDEQYKTPNTTNDSTTTLSVTNDSQPVSQQSAHPLQTPVPALLVKHRDNPKRMFATTRRKHVVFVTPKKILATTRRAHKAPNGV
jgi:hypothetical protein